MSLVAVQHIRRMRGGSQSHLMLGSDENLYVVKFKNNPQHVRVLANELIVTRLAQEIGLSVPHSTIIEVGPWLIDNTRELRFEDRRSWEPCEAGLQFGSSFVGGLIPGSTMDYLPETDLLQVRNLPEFAGMLALDKWTCNADGRQAVFSRRRREHRFSATFIDQGHCFNCGGWSFADAPLRGTYGKKSVYQGVCGWQSFEPWLTRIEKMSPSKIRGIAKSVPTEWFGEAAESLDQLVEKLILRRGRVRELIEAFRVSDQVPFPNWKSTRTWFGGPVSRARWVPEELTARDMKADSTEFSRTLRVTSHVSLGTKLEKSTRTPLSSGTGAALPLVRRV